MTYLAMLKEITNIPDGEPAKPAKPTQAPLKTPESVSQTTGRTGKTFANGNTHFDESRQTAPPGLRAKAIAQLREFEKRTHRRRVGRSSARRLLKLHSQAEAIVGERLTLSGSRAKMHREKNAN
jgi:hypothetical protein